MLALYYIIGIIPAIHKVQVQGFPRSAIISCYRTCARSSLFAHAHVYIDDARRCLKLVVWEGLDGGRGVHFDDLRLIIMAGECFLHFFFTYTWIQLDSVHYYAANFGTSLLAVFCFVSTSEVYAQKQGLYKTIRPLQIK